MGRSKPALLPDPIEAPLSIPNKPTDLKTDSNDGSEYFVEAILTHRTTSNKNEYLVKWLGYTNKFNSWEPETCFVNDVLLSEYKKRVRKQHRLSAVLEPNDEADSDGKGPKHATTLRKRKLSMKEYDIIEKPNADRVGSSTKKPKKKDSLSRKSLGRGNLQAPEEVPAADDDLDESLTAHVASLASPSLTPAHFAVESASGSSNASEHIAAAAEVELSPIVDGESNAANSSSSSTAASRTTPPSPHNQNPIQSSYEADAKTESSFTSAQGESRPQPESTTPKTTTRQPVTQQHPWTQEHLIPPSIFHLDSWDDHVASVANMDNKIDSGNINVDNYRVTLMWKEGVLVPEADSNKTFLGVRVVREKCKDRMLDFFLKNCRFK
ncbi:UNVERIFIED_CONTAM: Chromobox protein 8 [Siphonaria sp. JEL0065]|nr:Chromobox protein 8 [Siphonaria sp. JEL0065]